MLSGRRWSSGLRSARTAAWSGSGGKCSDRYCRSGPLYLQRTRVESVAERKLRRRQLTEEGNVEIWRTRFAKCQVGTADSRESVLNRPKADSRGAMSGFGSRPLKRPSRSARNWLSWGKRSFASDFYTIWPIEISMPALHAKFLPIVGTKG